MAKTRTIVSFLFFIVVSVFAVTAFAGDPSKKSDMDVCIEKCTAHAQICASETDVKKLCPSIPECARLPDADAKVINNFCDACRKSGDEKCTPQAPPQVTPAPAAANKGPKPQPKPATQAKPLTKEQLCKKQGGILHEGTCYTQWGMIKLLAEIQKKLEKGDIASKAELDALKKEIESLARNGALPESYKDYVNKLMKSNMDWVQAKFESVDYRLNLQANVSLIQGRRHDVTERRIAGVENKVETLKGGSTGFVGFHLGVGADAHTLQPYGATRFFVGAEGELHFKVVSPAYVMIGAGGGYAGEDLDLSLKTLRFRVGMGIVPPKYSWFHFTFGGVFDRTFDNIEHDLSSSYSLFVRPEFCVPNAATVCFSPTASIGYLDLPIRDTADKRSGGFSATFGLGISFVYMPQ